MKSTLTIFCFSIALFGVGFLTGKFIYQRENVQGDATVSSALQAKDARQVRLPPLDLQEANAEQINTAIDHEADTVEEKAHLATQIYRKLSKEDPISALNNAMELPDGLLRRNAILAAIDEWASTDSQAAFSWFTEHADGLPQLSSAYAVIMGHYIKQDSPSAGNLIQNMQAGDLKASLAGNLVSVWAENDVQSSLKWAESLTDPAVKQIALEISLQAYAQEDPAAAFEYSLKQEDPKLRDQLLDQVGLLMARTDPQKAADDIELFPKTVQPQVIGHIASSWSATAPEETRAWISEMPLGPVRDQAIEHAAQNLLRSDQSSSFELAASVNDSAKRYGLVRDVIFHWHRTDPEASREALANAERLTETQKENLTKDLEENGTVLDLVVPGD